LEILGEKYMTTTTFKRRITPLKEVELEDTYNGNSIEYEDFSTDLDVLGPLLHSLFQEHWQEVGLGHMVDGSVLELEFTAAPKICRIYDGYLTVVTEGWHMHLCVAENQGGATGRTPEHLRQVRRVSRAALYRRLNADGEARSWGIQFWNGAGIKMMTLFLPNAFLGEGEDLLPEHKPDLAKLGLYEQLRQIYVLGTMDIPYETNPIIRPYISVCRSTRCNAGRDWKSVHEALEQQLAESGLKDVELIASGCLEVCKMGPIVFYSGDERAPEHTWYARVTPDVAKEIVTQHVVENRKVARNIYPQPD
jgi:(2Fe-2S) ferredoxin